MAHLAIGKRISFDKLVSLVKKYTKEYNTAKDTFERYESCSMLCEISDFCIMRGGWEYKERVFNQAKN